MNVVSTIVLAVQMLSALGMIGLILMQHGKGADMGAAFGSGSRAACSAPAAAPTSCRAPPAVLAAVFFAAPCCWPTSAMHAAGGGSVLERRRGAPRRLLPASGGPKFPARFPQAPRTAPANAPASAPAAPVSGAGQIPTQISVFAAASSAEAAPFQGKL
jgi:preprotein translocase subunit SecG